MSRLRSLAVSAALLTLLAAAPADAAQQVGVKGRVTGVVTDVTGPPDTPVRHDLTGTGSTNLGATSLRGSVTGTGFIPSGACSGRLVLTTRRGTLTLRVSSARIGGFTDCPVLLSWTVVSGTKGYAGSRGSGSMHLTRAARTFRLDFDGPAAVPRLATTGSSPVLPLAALLLVVAAARLRTVHRPVFP